MSAFRPILIAAALAFGTLACSPGARDFDTAQPGDSAEPDDIDTDESDPDETDGDTADEVAAFRSLDGTLVIAASTVDAASSTIRIGYWSAATDLLCEADVVLVSATPTAPPADLPLYGWWKLALAEGADPCRWAPPAELLLGLGAMDERLGPALAANALADREPNLYALYESEAEGAPVYVFGVAGTVDQYAGTALPAASPPLPDGEHRIQTLHLLPLPQ